MELFSRSKLEENILPRNSVGLHVYGLEGNGCIWIPTNPGKSIGTFQQAKFLWVSMKPIIIYIYMIYAHTYLIFVTDTRTVSAEKKSVMWRNFKFLYMTDEEKSKISPHVD